MKALMDLIDISDVIVENNPTETMEKLGIYECDTEDFALCSFSDASKMDITGIIQDGLNFVEVEG